MPPFLSPRSCFMRREIFLLRSREHLGSGVHGLMRGLMLFQGLTCKLEGQGGLVKEDLCRWLCHATAFEQDN
jgi:hypothetical protein